MRRRDKKFSLYLSDDEMEMLRKSAQAACMDCNTFLRTLISGYEPRPAPDDRFYMAMDFIKEFSDKIDQIAIRADDPVNVIEILGEARKWKEFQNIIEKEYLRPKRREV